MFVLWSAVGINAALLIFKPIRCFLTHYSHSAVVTLAGMGAKLFLFPSEWWPLSRLAERCPALASDSSNSRSINEWLPLPRTAVLPALDGKIIIGAPTHIHEYRLGMCVLYVCSRHSQCMCALVCMILFVCV